MTNNELENSENREYQTDSNVNESRQENEKSEKQITAEKKSRRLGRKLNLAIAIVLILIVIVYVVLFFG